MPAIQAVIQEVHAPVPWSSAQGWEKWHDFNARSMQPLTQWFCAATQAAPGQRALDVACGSGLPSLALAAALQPGGSVLAIDHAPDMLAGAKRLADLEHARGLTHRVMSAQALEVESGSFDFATCAFGLMFCPDPVAAAAELKRALRPGGRCAVAVWDDAGKCPFFHIPFGALAQIAPAPPPAPGSRGMFGLAPASELERVLRAAGFGDVAVESRVVTFELESVAQYLEILGDMAAPMHTALTTLPAHEIERLKRLLEEGSREFASGGRLRLPATALCATARV